MTKYKITHDRNACIGCGLCTQVCPGNWVMDGGKSKPIKTTSKLACNEKAAVGCPVHCIKVQKV